MNHRLKKVTVLNGDFYLKFNLKWLQNFNINKMLKFVSCSVLPSERLLLSAVTTLKIQVCGLKFYYPKENVDTSDWPEYRKLRPIEKQPVYLFKPPKMPKMIKRMRGPEKVHNELIYKGFGVQAVLGGRLMAEHFETIRNMINKKLDEERMFAIWRVDDPWQPLAKRSTGKRLGGGKGSIHHYCTPVKAERIVVEIGGDIHEIEARKLLAGVAEVLPFPARFIRQKDLDKIKENRKWIEENNINPFTMEYVIRNNMGGCHNFLSPYDFKWYGSTCIMNGQHSPMVFTFYEAPINKNITCENCPKDWEKMQSTARVGRYFNSRPTLQMII